jgi:hypothetical protein
MTDPIDPSQTEKASTPDSVAPTRANSAAQVRERLPLPGIAAIAFYLVLLGGVIVLGVIGHHYPALFLILAACFLTASAGLIFLFRWAWALALAAVLLLSCYNLWIFATLHQGPSLIQGLLNFVFFLYLIRTEVRTKLR